MPLSDSEALALAEAYRRETDTEWLEGERARKYAAFWYFPIGHVRSVGVAVDKEGGRLTALGGEIGLADALWAYEHGFLPVPVTLRVTRVHDLDKAIEFLLYRVESGPSRTPNPNPRRAWLRTRLGDLPCEFQNERLWGQAFLFRKDDPLRWFDFVMAPADATARRLEPPGAVLRTPAGRPAQARDLKLRRPAACPQCGAGGLQKVCFGLPTDEALEAAKRGEIFLAGCFFTNDAPDWRCPRCGHQWFDETDPARQLSDR